MHDEYDFLMVHNEYDNQANKVRFYVNDWPEKLQSQREQTMSANMQMWTIM